MCVCMCFSGLSLWETLCLTFVTHWMNDGTLKRPPRMGSLFSQPFLVKGSAHKLSPTSRPVFFFHKLAKFVFSFDAFQVNFCLTECRELPGPNHFKLGSFPQKVPEKDPTESNHHLILGNSITLPTQTPDLSLGLAILKFPRKALRISPTSRMWTSQEAKTLDSAE